MKIIIESKPKADMRYDTWGDWFYRDGELVIQVAESPVDASYLVSPKTLHRRFTENEMFLIALHELVEVWLCRERGITQDMVDRFDFAYKNSDPDAEPGDDPDAPYGAEHRFAAIMEHLMAHQLGLRDYGIVR